MRLGCIGIIEDWIEDQRAAGNDDYHDRHSRAFHLLYGCDVFGASDKSAPIAPSFGIRRFTDHYEPDVGAFRRHVRAGFFEVRPESLFLPAGYRCFSLAT